MDATDQFESLDHQPTHLAWYRKQLPECQHTGGAPRTLLPRDEPDEGGCPARRDAAEVREVFDPVPIGAEDLEMNVEGLRPTGIQAQRVHSDARYLTTCKEPLGGIDPEAGK